MSNKVVDNCSHALEFVTNLYKTKKVCNKVVVPNQCKTQKMCIKAVGNYPFVYLILLLIEIRVKKCVIKLLSKNFLY